MWHLGPGASGLNGTGILEHLPFFQKLYKKYTESIKIEEAKKGRFFRVLGNPQNPKTVQVSRGGRA